MVCVVCGRKACRVVPCKVDRWRQPEPGSVGPGGQGRRWLLPQVGPGGPVCRVHGAPWGIAGGSQPPLGSRAGRSHGLPRDRMRWVGSWGPSWPVGSGNRPQAPETALLVFQLSVGWVFPIPEPQKLCLAALLHALASWGQQRGAVTLRKCLMTGLPSSTSPSAQNCCQGGLGACARAPTWHRAWLYRGRQGTVPEPCQPVALSFHVAWGWVLGWGGPVLSHATSSECWTCQEVTGVLLIFKGAQQLGAAAGTPPGGSTPTGPFLSCPLLIPLWMHKGLCLLTAGHVVLKMPTAACLGTTSRELFLQMLIGWAGPLCGCARRYSLPHPPRPPLLCLPGWETPRAHPLVPPGAALSPAQPWFLYLLLATLLLW